jgi:hypothetical protein
VHTDGLLKIAVGGKVKVFCWDRLGSMCTGGGVM